MFTHITRIINAMGDSLLLSLYYATHDWGWVLSLIAGTLIPFAIITNRKDHEYMPFFSRLAVGVGILLFLFGTLSPFTVPIMLNGWVGGDPLPVIYNGTAYAFGPLFIIGVVLHVFLKRHFTPLINELKHNFTQKTKLARNERTDVREIHDFLPKSLAYDPDKYIDLSKGIFIGLNENHNPQYIPVADWQKQHADIIGTTGAGKGVASGLLLYQSILAGEGVFVCDPKDDEWAPHLFRFACEKAEKPFYLIDLRKPEYQLNMLADIEPEQLEELFIAGFSLAEKGEAADFYRIDDRRAARAASNLCHEHKTLRSLFGSDYVQGIFDDIKGFYGKLEELALLNSINAEHGLSLKDIFDHGGCCYIIGSMRNSKVIAAQRMLLVRILQIAETRDRIKTTPRPIAIFLDELKYHLSRPALEGLGAARDKGVHIIMAHQSIADLRDCPADLNGDAVVGAVVENAKFKLVYKLQDPDTAEWVARMSGTILVDDETRKTEANEVLTEVLSGERSIRQAERYFIDTNMLLNLPRFVSFIFTTDLARASLISPVLVEKKALMVYSVHDTSEKPETSPADYTESENTSNSKEPEFIDEHKLPDEPEPQDEFESPEEPEFDDKT